MNLSFAPSPRRAGALLRPLLSVGVLLLGGSLAGCATTAKTEPGVGRRGPAVEPGAGLVGEVIEEGLLDCFEAGADKADEPGEPANCEVSAATFVGGNVLLASDKPVPGEGRSSVLEVGIASVEGSLRLEQKPRRYLTALPLLGARKAEDFALEPGAAPGEERVFLTTAFDRLKADSTEWHAYNTLLTWPAIAPAAAQVVNAREVEGVVSSVDLIEPIRQALAGQGAPSDDADAGPAYFKVEGLAALPGGRLLFGVRERGPSYKDFEYALDLVEARYEADEAGLVRVDPASFRLVWRRPPTLVLGHRVAVSSLAWDEARGRLYLLTSFEHEDADEALGGFLLVLDEAALEAGRAPAVVRRPDGRPLMFGHKPEGVAVLDEFTLLVVHDDDRVTSQQDLGDPALSFDRGRHQAPWSIVRLSD